MCPPKGDILNKIYGPKINKTEQPPKTMENQESKAKTRKSTEVSGNCALRPRSRMESQCHEQDFASNQSALNTENPTPKHNMNQETDENTSKQQPIGRHCLPTVICERRKSIPEPLHQSHQIPEGRERNKHNANEVQVMSHGNENYVPISPAAESATTNSSANKKPFENVKWHHPQIDIHPCIQYAATLPPAMCEQLLRESQDAEESQLPPQFLFMPPYNRYPIPQPQHSWQHKGPEGCPLRTPPPQYSSVAPQVMPQNHFQDRANNIQLRRSNRLNSNDINHPAGTTQNCNSGFMQKMPCHPMQTLSQRMPLPPFAPGHTSNSRPPSLQPQVALPQQPMQQMPLTFSVPGHASNSRPQSLQPQVPQQLPMPPQFSVPGHLSNFLPPSLDLQMPPQPSIPGQTSNSVPHSNSKAQLLLRQAPTTSLPSPIPCSSSHPTQQLVQSLTPHTPPLLLQESKKAKAGVSENVTPNSNFKNLMVMMESIQNAILTQQDETISPEQVQQMYSRFADVQKLMKITKDEKVPVKRSAQPNNTITRQGSEEEAPDMILNPENAENATQLDSYENKNVILRTPSVIMKVDQDSKVSGPVPVLVLKDKPKVQENKVDDNLRNRKSFAGENQLVIMNTGRLINYAPMVQFNNEAGSRELTGQSGNPADSDIHRQVPSDVNLANESECVPNPKKLKTEKVDHIEIDKEDINLESRPQTKEFKVSANDKQHLKQQSSNPAVLAVTTTPKDLCKTDDDTSILKEKTISSLSKKVLVSPVNIKVLENRIITKGLTPDTHSGMHAKNYLDPATIKEGTLTPEEYVAQMDALVKKNVPQDFIEFYDYITRVQILRDQNPITFDVFLELHNGGKLGSMYQAFEKYKTDKLEVKVK